MATYKTIAEIRFTCDNIDISYDIAILGLDYGLTVESDYKFDTGIAHYKLTTKAGKYNDIFELVQEVEKYLRSVNGIKLGLDAK